MELEFELDGIDAAAGAVLQAAGAGRIMAFEGEMGAGKTTFISAICRQLGVSGTVSSPTFSIINEYRSPNGPLFHIDLYRCRSEEEAVRAGVEDCLYSGSRCLVEWPSIAPGIFPADTVPVTIVQNEAGGRKIVVNCKK